MLWAEERSERQVDRERHLVEAPSAGGGELSLDVALNQHIVAISLCMHVELALFGAGPELSLAERGGQPILADGKAPILPRLVEVLNL